MNNTDTFRAQLLAVAEQAAFPGEKRVDPQTGVAALEPQDEAMVRTVFDLFGIGALDPNDDDFDKVLNTVCGLVTEVGVHLLALAAGDGSVDELQRRHGWHPDYADYLAALWQGDREAIAVAAWRLNLHQGIPNGSPPLDAGPLPLQA